MIILNQHTYEEFFLLYADGELNASDKLAVDRFIEANPDLAVELDLLLQMRLPAEEYVFGDKGILFRSEAAEINLTNSEEHFLLYVDNELNAAEKQKLETFVLQHPSLQESFTQLKQTRLEAETILFPAKESLYRKEEKERPVFYMQWQRMAVAAAFIGIALLLWTVLPQNRIDQPLASSSGTTLQPGNTIVQPANTLPTANDQPAPVNNHTATTGLVASVNNNKETAPVTNSKAIGNSNALPVTNADIKIQDPVKTAELGKGDIIAAVSHNGFETATTSTQRISGENTILDAADAVRTVASGPSPETASDNIQPAVYRELDTEAADQKKSLLLGSLEINKDKLRGFFRKAGSIFRSKSKADDDKTETHPASNSRSLK